jgi:deoxyribodipyrimidine photo-lyase
VLAKWAAAASDTHIVTSYITRGLLMDWVGEVQPFPAAKDISLRRRRCEWDSTIWPRATAGFFKVRKQIPNILM